MPHRCYARPAGTDFTSPTIPDKANRSYLINGWNYYFADALNVSRSMKEVYVVYHRKRIFGEKRKKKPHPAMDSFLEDLQEGVGNDVDKVEQGCHGVI